MESFPELNTTQNSRSAHAAIRGYLYQFEYSALKILTDGQDTVARVEGLEDLDLLKDDGITAIQIKYLESKATFSNKSIAKPLYEMYKSFRENPTLKFCMYVHFDNNASVPSSLTKEDVKDAFESNTVSEKISSNNVENYIEFVKSVKLIAGPTINDQRNELKRKIAKVLNCDEQEAMQLHLPRAVHYINKIASDANEHNRTVTSQQLRDALNIRRFYFLKWQEEYLDQEAFIAQLIKTLKTSGFADHAKFRVMGITISEPELTDAIELVKILSANLTSGKALSSHQPWTLVVREKQEKSYKEFKRKLVEQSEIVFNDGCEEIHFSRNRFLSKPLVICKRSSNQVKAVSYAIRIVEDINYKTLSLDEQESLGTRTCWFGWDSESNESNSGQHFNFSGLQLSTINRILEGVV